MRRLAVTPTSIASLAPSLVVMIPSGYTWIPANTDVTSPSSFLMHSNLGGICPTTFSSAMFPTALAHSRSTLSTSSCLLVRQPPHGHAVRWLPYTSHVFFLHRHLHFPPFMFWWLGSSIPSLSLIMISKICGAGFGIVTSVLAARGGQSSHFDATLPDADSRRAMSSLAFCFNQGVSFLSSAMHLQFHMRVLLTLVCRFLASRLAVSAPFVRAFSISASILTTAVPFFSDPSNQLCIFCSCM